MVRGRVQAAVAVLVAVVWLAGAAPPVGAAGSVPATAPTTTGRPATQASPGPPADLVVLIGFDGFDDEYLGRAPMPNLEALAAEGVIGRTHAPLLPITNPSFASLVSGAWPNRTRNLAYWWDKGANTYRGQTRAIDVPTIAEVLRARGDVVGAAQYFILQGNGVEYRDPDALYTQPGGPCSRRFDDAVAMLRGEPVDSGGTATTLSATPSLLAVYCDDLDSIGHAEGAESPNLLTAMVELDQQVGRLVAEVEAQGLTDRTTFVLTGDHGMSSYTRTFGAPMFTALRDAGFTPQFLFAAGQSVAATTDVVLVPAGRTMMVYLAGDRREDPASWALLETTLASVEGTLRPAPLGALLFLAGDNRSGDFIVQSQPGWGAGILPPAGTRGDHGSYSEVWATFVMSGAGVRDVDSPASILHVDVAPTIARLLGAPAPARAQGKALTQYLTA